MALEHRRARENHPVRAQIEDGDASALRELRRQAKTHPALTEGELDELLTRSSLGDHASQDRVVAAHLALVIRLADERHDQGLAVLDLVQEGSLGLVEAVRNFAQSGSVAFASIAEREIARAMDAAVAAEAQAVRDAQLLVEAATDYERTEILLQRELKRVPAERDIAEKLEWTVERTRYVAQVVADARRRHDEEILAFIDPEAIDFDRDERDDLDA
ncbi:MAG TPA: sigma factor [Vicinamibacterales bacterium]|nr:sigma factor [Vicinamibacterales bacterium]